MTRQTWETPSPEPKGVLTREELAKELGLPEAQLSYTPHVPRLGNRKQRRKMERLMKRKAK